MAIQKILSISGRCLPVLGADIDTDRIIPARFLKAITFDDLAGTVFHDERFTQDGASKNHPIDNPKFAGANVMLVGPNFGCGSSREHAPQAIKRSGIDAILGESFSEIFFGNSTGIGLPCVCASAGDIKKLAQIVEEQPETIIELDLAEMKVRIAGHATEEFPITMPTSAREALVSGRWDAVADLLSNEELVGKIAAKIPYFNS